ncbi:MAG: hypothetical protein WAV73_01815, partial [Candidatus Moraniibacteriota bacterium]
LVTPYDWKVENPEDGYAIEFAQIKNEKSDIQIKKTKPENLKKTIEIKNAETTIKSNPKLATEIISGSANLTFEKATINLKKTGPVNAIITCQAWDEKTNDCRTNWELVENSRLSQLDDTTIAFQIQHFSAYAGVYLNIVNVQSNLTQGDDWTVNFNTYGQSDLKIEATDGTNYDTDIQFESLSCGANPIPENQIEKVGNLITVKNYQCDNETSNIKNKAITSGRHWLAFTFGDTEKVKAHNFACDSGTLDDTCTVSSTQTMSNGDIVSGTGNLVLASGGTISAVATSRFTLTMTGDITVESGGTISGNALITAANVNINSGGSINVDGKGYTGGNQSNGAGPGGGQGGTVYTNAAGGGYGGVGGNNTKYNPYLGGTTYGIQNQPTDFGSGGGGVSDNSHTGGNGGGAIKLTVTNTLTVDGSLTANGNSGSGNGSTSGGGGSGGSIWVSTGTLAGAGTITVNGGNAPSTSAGGGGGGRIAIFRNTSTYSGTPTATKGTNGVGTADGTIINTTNPTQMKTGLYVGSGAALSITGLGFQPSLVIIKSTTNAGSLVFKTS